MRAMTPERETYIPPPHNKDRTSNANKNTEEKGPTTITNNRPRNRRCLYPPLLYKGGSYFERRVCHYPIVYLKGDVPLLSYSTILF